MFLVFNKVMFCSLVGRPAILNEEQRTWWNIKCLVMCVTLWGLACVLTGGGREREQKRDIDRENYPEIQVSCEASAGVQGYTCQRPGPLSLSRCLLSVSLFLSSWTLNPPPSLHLPDPGHFSPAMHGHLWEFIPDASCSLHPLLPLSPSLFVLILSFYSSFCYLPHNTSLFSHALDFYLNSTTN